MPKQPIDEQMIIDYLLGVLPETEIERLDEMSITDNEFADKLRAVENDLVDAYVRGELSGKTLTQFKSHYLASPRRREKVTFAETFVTIVNNPSTTHLDKNTLKNFSRKGFSLAPIFQWGLAAAALVMLLAGGFLLFENMRLRNQIDVARTNQELLKQREQELQRQLAERQSSDIETENELARVRKKLAELELQLASTEPEQGDVKIIAFNLLPQTRSVSKIPIINVPKGTDYIAMTLDLEPNDFSKYQGVLKSSVSDEVLWRNGTLKANKNNQLQIRLPVNLLKSQNYLIEVSGIAPSGTPEIVSTYPFKISLQ